MISPINTDYAIFIWRGTPVLSFSKKFSRYRNNEILWCLNATALSNLYMYISHSKYNMDWNLFFHYRFYITLLIIIFTRMFDIQYWQCDNSCHILKIRKVKSKILIWYLTWWKLYLIKIYIKLVYLIYFLYWGYAILNFPSKFRDHSPNKITRPQQYDPPPAKIKISDLLPPPQQTFLKFLTPLSHPTPNWRGCMPWCSVVVNFFIPFLINVSILYLLKIPENLWFPVVFRGYTEYYLFLRSPGHLQVSSSYLLSTSNWEASKCSGIDLKVVCKKCVSPSPKTNY